MIRKLADDNVGQHARASRAFLNRLRGFVCCFYRAIAGVFQSHILDYLDRGGDELVAFAGFFRDEPQVLAAATAVFFGFSQIVYDPFPNYVLRQRLPPAALVRLLLVRLVLLLLNRGLGFFVFRTADLPQRFESCLLLFPELFAFPRSLRLEQFTQQAPQLVFFRTLVLELLAKIDNDLAQRLDVFRQSVGVDRRHDVLSA